MSEEGKGGWVFATSEEYWTRFDGYDTREDALSHAIAELDLKPGDNVFTGFAVKCDYNDLATVINSDASLESLKDAAFDNWGWEDAFDETSGEQQEDLQEMLRDAYRRWVQKHQLVPSYFHIDNVKKHVVPDQPDVNSGA